MRYFTPQTTLCLLVLATSTVALHVANEDDSKSAVEGNLSPRSRANPTDRTSARFQGLQLDSSQNVPNYNVDAERTVSRLSPRHRARGRQRPSDLMKPKNCKHHKKPVPKKLNPVHNCHHHHHKKPDTKSTQRKKTRPEVAPQVAPIRKKPSSSKSGKLTTPSKPMSPAPVPSGKQLPKGPVETAHGGKASEKKGNFWNEVDQTQALALAEINKFRQTHGAAPLETSSKLVHDALAWATECIYKHTPGAFTGQYGEIIAWTSGEIPGNMTEAIELWTSEEKDYNPAKPMYSHFTQIVWKSSVYLGCASNSKCNRPNHKTTITGRGVGKNLEDTVLFICRFIPAGNIMDKDIMNANVQVNLPGKGHRP
ncbi:BQ2448_1693 [Microbotryum intermedium]|uniref:BQ2448_1693 protein n=1 Tax=Microbotryum intermedium TaxID=269621 RepID=A0A238FBY4_9BASI|nr:BQ2448_1693 [Microbotryum intermedium]